MPPAAQARRAQPPAPVEQGRRSSGRQVRSSISRPTNYYARPFGSMSLPVEDSQDDTPPGFYPAVQYFSDAVAALPKEVMRHFTLMKEVEAKIYGPSQEMARIIDRITQLPSPPRKSFQPSRQALLSFTANNSSVGGSTNVSMVNGNVPGLAPPAIPDPVDHSSQISPADEQLEMKRRQEFNNLRITIMHVLQNLDEKNGCLAEANRALDKELGRMDSVMPHVESEISEEARLGSLTHWAYADNRKKNTSIHGQDRSRRDVAATSNLAAAAAAIHEGEIAAARNEGRRETKKSRLQQQVDSEMDDRLPGKKVQKGRKGLVDDLKAASAASASQPAPKKRKVEKLGGAGMERSASTAGKAGKGAASTPRATPAAEVAKKKSRPPVPPLSKKRNPGASSPAQSPRLAASPIVQQFAGANELPGGRPASRMRQQSASTLQNSVLASRVSPPKEVTKKASNDGGANGDEAQDQAKTKEEAEDVPMADVDHTNSNTHESKEPAAEIKAQDSTANRHDTSAIMSDGDATPDNNGRHSDGRSRDRSAHIRRTAAARNGEIKHSRSGSGSHILKQIASFNRSPVMGRRSLPGTEDESSEEESRRRSQSRNKRTGRATKRQESRARSSDVEDAPAPPPLEPDVEEVDEQAEVEDEEHDVDDPDEPKYCYCGRGSYGTMIGCENENCEREWFHLECTGLRAVPGDNVKWYCDDCDPRSRKKSKGRH